MKKLIVFLTSIFCFITFQNSHAAKQQLQIGNVAPRFILLNQNGEPVTLSDFTGQKIALCFYPKDNTSGCLQEACSLRDDYVALQKAGITVLGVSRGSIKSKQKFMEKNQLPFMLLIGTKEMLKDYGVNKGFWWWTLGLPKRWTFLINEYGIIVGIIKNVDTKHHAQQILDTFNAIK